MSARKSYWQSMACRTERDRIALKSWFSPLADDLTPESAEGLFDIATDREKKLRVIMTDREGGKHVFTRTFGGKTVTVTTKRLAPPLDSGIVQAPAPVKAPPPARSAP